MSVLNYQPAITVTLFNDQARQRRGVAIRRPLASVPLGLGKPWPDGRVVLSILRQAAEPMSSRDIALEILATRALDKSDQRLMRLLTKRVGVALRIQRDNGLVEAEQGTGQFVLWKVMR